MKHKEEDESPIQEVQEEVRHLMQLIRVLARTLGYSNAALARRAKVPIASLVRYFKGEGEPKLEFLLAVLRALGLNGREFFELAYPIPAEVTESRAKIERILGPIRPGRVLEGPAPYKPEPRPEMAPLQREDFEKMLEDLRRDVRKILGERTKSDEKSEESERPRRENGES